MLCYRQYYSDISDNGAFERAIDLDIDIGADAVDYNAIAKAGGCFSLSPYLHAH